MSSTDNIRVRETTDGQIFYRYLLMAVLLVGAMALVIGLASLTTSASPLPPTINSDVYIGDTEYYDNSSTDLSAYIYVQSGGNLTLDNVDIEMVGYSGIEVESGGILLINGTSVPNNYWDYSITLDYGGSMIITNSDIEGYTSLNLGDTNCSINNNTLVPEYDWYNAFSVSLDWNSYSVDGPFITNNTFGGNSGMNVNGYYTTMGKIVIDNNVIGDNYNYNGINFNVEYASITDIEFNNNTFGYISNWGVNLDIQYATIPTMNFNDNNMDQAYYYGIYVNGQSGSFQPSNWSFSGNKINSQGFSSIYYGIYISAYYATFGNIRLDNNNITSYDYGFYFDGYQSIYSGIHMFNNYIYAYWSYPVYIYASSGNLGTVAIHNNTLSCQYTWYPMYYISFSWGSIGDFNFSDNFLNHTGQVFSFDSYGSQWGNIDIENNVLNDTQSFWNFGYSYSNTNVGDFVFKNNTMTNLNGYAVNCGSCYYYQFNSITIKDNYITNGQSDAFYFYDYYGGVTYDVNIVHNTIKNQNYGNMFQFYMPRYSWNGGTGIEGWLNITDNKLDTLNNWGSGFYIYASDSNMKGLNVERNVVLNIGSWETFYFDMGNTVFQNDVKITNNTVARSQNGITFYGWSCTMPNLFMQNNTVINTQQDGIEMDIGGINANVFVDSNLIIDNSNYGLDLYGGGGNFPTSTVNNNTLLKNGEGMYIDTMNGLKLADNKITSNRQTGIEIYGNWNVQDIYNSYNNIISNNGNDIVAEQGCIFKSHNDTFATTNMQNWGAQSNPEIWVMGSMDIQVLWLDGTGPVADADLKVYNKAGDTVLDDRVDTNGWYKGIDIMLYKIKTDGKTMNIPVTINASKYGILDSEKVTPGYHSVVKVFLDNVPPDITVLSPQDKMQTNKNYARVSGLTEPDATLTINGVPINLTKAGGFEYYAPLQREGNNDIKIIGKDRFNNTRIVLLHVIRDTIPPQLVVDQPTEGQQTNQPSIVVRGQSEPGATVRINENIVTMDANGRFEYTVLLTEGANNITITATDLAGNTVQQWRDISLDSVPPSITIVTPSNGLITNSPEIDIRGMANGATSLKLNGIAVKLLGETFVTTMKLIPGVNTLLFEATDDAGNYASLQISIVQDANPPQLNIIYPKDNLFTGNSVLVISGSSDVGNTVTVNGVPVVLDPNNGQFSYTVLLKEGTNRIVARATDKIGNTYEVVRNVFLDTTPPALTVTNPIDQQVTSTAKISVEGLTDLNAVITINGNVVPTEAGAFKKSVTLKEGLNRIIILATDLAGNRNMVVREVTLDTTATVQIYSPADGLRTTSDNISFFGKVEPGGSIKINGLDILIDNTSSFSHIFPLQLGANDFEMTVTDGHGNTNTLTRTVVREQVPPAPSKKSTSALSDASGWLAAALVGAIVGALMAIIIFLLFSRKMVGKKSTLDDIEAQDAKAQTEKEAALEAPPTKPAPPLPPKATDKKVPPPIRMVPPPVPVTTAEAPKPPEPKPKEPDPFSPTEEEAPVAVKGMTDKAAGGEIEVDGGELTDLQKKVETLDAKGADTTKIKQSLRMAEIYQSKNNPDKAEKHIQKAKQMLTEMDSSGEIAPKGDDAIPVPVKSSIPVIPPFPDMDKGAPRKAKLDTPKDTKDGGK